jgi:hypothetical protein
LYQKQESDFIYNNISRCNSSFYISHTSPINGQLSVDVDSKIIIYFNQDSCTKEKSRDILNPKYSYVFAFSTPPIYTKPKSPLSISLINKTSSSISISWEESIDFKNIKEYYLSYKIDTKEYSEEKKYTINKASINLLQENTKYIFKIRAKDKKGYFSEPLISSIIKTDSLVSQKDMNVIRDANACIGAFPWYTISNQQPSLERESVSKKQSIAIQSFGFKTILYYKELDNMVDTPYGFEISTSKGLPLKDGTYSRARVFNIFANKAFLGSGYYYVKIDTFCYRGKFPVSTSDEDIQIAQDSIKFVIN